MTNAEFSQKIEALGYFIAQLYRLFDEPENWPAGKREEATELAKELEDYLD